MCESLLAEDILIINTHKIKLIKVKQFTSLYLGLEQSYYYNILIHSPEAESLLKIP